MDHERQRSGDLSCCLRPSIRKRVTKASRRSSSKKSFEGFSVGKKEDKLGIRASSTTELILDNCKVPKENVLGEVGKGYKVSIETLNEGRIGIGAQMLGIAQGAYEAALKYTAEREQFGQSINSFQAVQFQLAEMAVEIEATRLLVYNAARLKDAGKPFLKEAAMAKLYSSRCRRSTSRQKPSSSTAATATSKIIRSKNSGATQRSARSTKAPRTCSSRRSRS